MLDVFFKEQPSQRRPRLSGPAHQHCCNIAVDPEPVLGGTLWAETLNLFHAGQIVLLSEKCCGVLQPHLNSSEKSNRCANEGVSLSVQTGKRKFPCNVLGTRSKSWIKDNKLSWTAEILGLNFCRSILKKLPILFIFLVWLDQSASFDEKGRNTSGL